MNHTLVTFLGRANHGANAGNGKAEFLFPEGDGHPVETAFFGLALARYLKVDAIVILGTSGSRWSVLVENLAPAGEDEEARIQLLDAERDATVTQRMLDRAARIMSAAVGIPVDPRLIPFGENGKEQCDILGIIADAIADGEVSFDLTHGLRHLGIVGFLSAFMLERMRKLGRLTVRGLWYGARDLTKNGVTPALRMDGLIRVRRWVEALDRFDATGDYGVFAPLLVEDGIAREKVRCLEKAAFHERTMNLSDARRQLQTFLPTLDEQWSGASGLFRDCLSERLGWVDRTNLAGFQEKLALEYLGRRDFLRAAAFGGEALVTVECTKRGYDANDFRSGREAAIEEFRKEIENDERKAEAFRTLQAVRDALVHGNPPHRRYRRILDDPGSLHDALRGAFQCLNADHDLHSRLPSPDGERQRAPLKHLGLPDDLFDGSDPEQAAIDAGDHGDALGIWRGRPTVS